MVTLPTFISNSRRENSSMADTKDGDAITVGKMDTLSLPVISCMVILAMGINRSTINPDPNITGLSTRSNGFLRLMSQV
jgi:hypothetical protein